MDSWTLYCYKQDGVEEHSVVGTPYCCIVCASRTRTPQPWLVLRGDSGAKHCSVINSSCCSTVWKGGRDHERGDGPWRRPASWNPLLPRHVSHALPCLAHLRHAWALQAVEDQKEPTRPLLALSVPFVWLLWENSRLARFKCSNVPKFTGAVWGTGTEYMGQYMAEYIVANHFSPQ